MILISSFLFLILLLTTYTIKRKDKDLPSKLFFTMLLTNIINTILVLILFKINCLNINNKLVYINLLSRFDLWLTVFFTSLILMYTFTMLKKELNNYLKLFTIFNTILFILIFILPIKLNYFSFNGLAAKISFIIMFIIIIINLITIILNSKKNKKYIIISIILLLSYLTFLSTRTCYYFPVKSIMFTLINYLMYFFLENPDYKLVLKIKNLKDKELDKNEAKTEYLTNISYKMRTPLNAIIGLSQTISESDNLEEIHKNSQDLITASTNLQEIIGDVLNISEIEEKKLTINKEKYNPRQELEKIIKIYELKCREKHIDLKCYFTKDIPEFLNGDKNKIKDIISYVLSNSIKFTENGDIDFRVTSTLKNNNCLLNISIQDTGKGLEKDKIKDIFNSQDNNLSLVKNIIELMHGKIEIQSSYGNGTKIIITLEQEIPTPDNYTIISPKKNIDLKNKVVLVVDDNALNIKVAQNMLKKYDFKLETAISGQECLEKIKTGQKYDLIFMDDMMPNMSGTETLKKLKELPDFKAHVVVLTANATEDTRSKYLASGFEDYLSKPINKDELDKIIKKYLNSEGQKATFEPLPKDLYEISSETIEKFK